MLGAARTVAQPSPAPLLQGSPKLSVKWSQPGDFFFAGRIREQPRQRNSVRTRILYSAIEKANELLGAEDRPPLPDGLTFHSLRRTYAALCAELGEYPAITAAQMGHRDPRMTLRVYTDVTGMRPKTRMGGLLGGDDWAEMPISPEVRRTRSHRGGA